MAKSSLQKLKLLYLRDYLQRNTDEAHPASVSELIGFLAEQGIRAERKSIYDDMLALYEYGMQVEYRRKKPSGYYVAQRDFDLSEIKFLIDAVLSSRFLTPAQSSALVAKLANLSGRHRSALLRRQIVLSGRIKSASDDALIHVDLLHEAIEQNRQIAFRYFDWGTDRRKHFRSGEYVASPYALLWDDENYYLIAHSDRHGLTHYRVDKMESIRLTELPRIVTEETKAFDPSTYSKAVFGMYRGKTERVKLRFEQALAGVVIDRFGRDIMLIPDGETHFTFTTEVSVSPNFLGWLAGFGGRASVVFPPCVVEEYRSFCQAALSVLPQEAKAGCLPRSNKNAAT